MYGRQLMEMQNQANAFADGGKAAYKREVVEKWAPYMEGLDNRSAHGRRVRAVLAECFESSANFMLKPRSLLEATTTANVGYYAKFVFPALRWAIPNLIANETVSVQPMNSAQANVFFLDYVYGNTKGQVTEGEQFPRDFDRNYSSEYVEGEMLAQGDGTNFGGAGAALSVTLTYNPVHRPSTTRGFSVIVREISAATGAVVQEATVNEAGTFVGPGGTTGSLNFANGGVSGFKFNAAPANGNFIRAFYYYDSELNSKIPEMQLDIKKALVQAGIRKLKTVISAEGAMDLREEHGIDAEGELIATAAQELALSTDREIIEDLFKASIGTQAAFNRVPAAGQDELSHLRSLITKMSQVSSAIHTKTLRAPATFGITSPAISALLEQFTTHGDYRPIFAPDMDPTNPIDQPRPMTRHGQYGIYRLGTLMSKWVIYVDPFFHNDFMLMGLKGSSYLDAGYAYCPYVPMQVSEPFRNPDNLSIVTALYTRYARLLMRPEFYGQVRVSGL